MTDDTTGFAVLCGKSVSRREGQAALDDLSSLFRKMFVENVSKLTSSSVSVFSKPAKDLLLSSGNGPDSLAKINEVKSAVDEAKGLAMDNVERLIQRDQKIDDIIHASEDLLYHSDGFGRNSRALSDQIWWNSMKGKIIIFGTAAVFLFMVFFVFFTD
ncbi:vesicle-associated membrane protein 7 [Angomonas deanei]|nr:vesicle-associated membrane protein 7 [Angomonas deanei]|eukprot:EPY42662.1 vesicle-associated membrane protein 7 [Angomonas deanei]